jgi:hypothetical protein
MTRQLRVGDRVTATGTVTRIAGHNAYVRWEGEQQKISRWHSGAALTLIEPAEPPVGSVVVKDGVAWTREFFALTEEALQWRGDSGMRQRWADLSDGDVIFQPGVTK